MSDVKSSETPDVKNNDIDAVDSPELNADATRDDESEDLREIAEAESGDVQGDEPEGNNDSEENSTPEDDSTESIDEESENEEEKDEVQNDEPQDNNDIDEKSIPEDGSTEDIDEESENEEEKEEDNEAEDESEDIQDDEPEKNNDIEEKNISEDDPTESIDEDSEDEEEKEENNEVEDENKEVQDDEPQDNNDIDEKSIPEDDSTEDIDEESENEEEKEEDNKVEDESEEVQDDEPQDNNDIDEKSIPEDDSTEDIAEESENEEEKDNEAEDESEEVQDDEPQDNNDVDEKSTPEDDSAEGVADESEEDEENIEIKNNSEVAQNNERKESEERRETTEKKSKLHKTLKWAGIVSLPLIATALLLFLKPTVTSNLFSTTELQIHTPKTAAMQWTAEELEMINVVGQTLTETEKIWDTIFTKKGGIYKKPDFTIFTGRISSACAEKQENELLIEQSSLGTFYCPEERRIYIDLSLHRDLKNRLDIPGDFAQGYIVAHEIGHHVQNLAGISAQIPAARLRLSDKEFEMVSQRLELQADCFAGIWARHAAEAQYNVRPDEFADTLDAVTHYSRQHLKQKKDNDIMPNPFTHGSPRLRLRWFTIGYDKGTFDACDTFTVMEL